MSKKIVDEFEALWESSQSLPDVFGFLTMNSTMDSSAKLAVLLVDQKYRWKSPHPLKVEDYLAHLRKTSLDAEFIFRLAVGEFEARKHCQQTPRIEEYTTRFAMIGAPLREELSKLAEEQPNEGNREYLTTQTFLTDSKGSEEKIGRYRLIRILGEGAFGRVWLGVDEELRRQVAIKEPKPERFQKPVDAKAYLAEARILASLDHPNILPVHDVGCTETGLIYVVSKWVRGQTLAELIKNEPPAHSEAAQLLGKIALALHYAHEKRLIHRDVKPSNLLIEADTGTPYVADFGLAIREQDPVMLQQIAGTPAYMSPEQARGEGHRLDGRSDVFSLGVVLYELLTGKRPFFGSSFDEILHGVVSVEPLFPRELDETIPWELDRICRKAMSKRASDRYNTAAEMAEDLFSWDKGTYSSQQEQMIVPKGLRSFDKDDSDFFLDLLPGPRNRGGLPESIQFWKTRIEETDSDQTFSVGLIYGPSGCGKSSLIKAGLLPRLASEISPVYVESTPEETETRLLRGLRKLHPFLPAELDVFESINYLRRKTVPKIVLILDQFEQWLHVHQPAPDNLLVSALRQCDGVNLQAILMVRDDFAMAAARFMHQLETEIVQGKNFTVVDQFDLDHGTKVLAKYGQAWSKLPANLDQFSASQKEFLKAAVQELAVNGKIVSVHLALFAEMMKHKPWEMRTLKVVGGTEGIGLYFLEETFCSSGANPEHRFHLPAIRNVLSVLLPEIGTDIKGTMQSRQDLCKAAGYESRLGDFNTLLRILDGELRLITPTTPAGSESNSGSDLGTKYYQLTHDYLVSPLRDWLTQKQKETRRGRATLRLEELQVVWSTTRNPRHLPGVADWLRIHCLSPRRNWSLPQKDMMGAASRHHVIRLSGLIIFSFLVFLIGWNYYESARIHSLVQKLRSAHLAEVPSIMEQLKDDRPASRPLLWQLLKEPEDSREHFNVSLALLDEDPKLLNGLMPHLYAADHEQLGLLCGMLHPCKKELTPRLWAEVNAENEPKAKRLRAAHLLAHFAPPVDETSRSKWEKIAPFLADELITQTIQNLRDYPALVSAFYPVSKELLEPMNVHFCGQDPQRRSVATSWMVELFQGNPRALATILPDADTDQFLRLVPHLTPYADDTIPVLKKIVQEPLPQDVEDEVLARFARRKATAAAAILRINPDEKVAWELFRHVPDPTVRTSLIHLVNSHGVPPETVLEHFGTEDDPSIRRAFLQALGEYPTHRLEPDLLLQISMIGQERLASPDPGTRASAEWLLRKHKLYQPAAMEVSTPVRLDDRSQPSWFRDGHGHRLVALKIPNSSRSHHVVAIADREVSVAQFKQFTSDYQPHRFSSPTDDCPANVISWNRAVGYCNWLTREEGLGEENLCYYYGQTMGEWIPHQDFLDRTGYRLPLRWEWSHACRAGAVTDHSFGRDQSLQTFYSWTISNSERRLWPGGHLKPNEFGMFDMHGNAMEWGNDRIGTSTRILFGGSAKTRFNATGVSNVNAYLPETTFYSIGFRVVRSLNDSENQHARFE